MVGLFHDLRNWETDMAIRDYFPKKVKMTTLQVRMPEKLVRDVQREMKDDNYENWKEFLTACFKAYLEDKKESISKGEDEKKEKK